MSTTHITIGQDIDFAKYLADLGGKDTAVQWPVPKSAEVGVHRNIWALFTNRTPRY